MKWNSMNLFKIKMLMPAEQYENLYNTALLKTAGCKTVYVL